MHIMIIIDFTIITLYFTKFKRINVQNPGGN